MGELGLCSFVEANVVADTTKPANATNWKLLTESKCFFCLSRKNFQTPRLKTTCESIYDDKSKWRNSTKRDSLNSRSMRNRSLLQKLRDP